MLNDFAMTLKNLCRVEPGMTVLIGVSGGADSVALLHLFHELASDWQLSLQTAHLDHALRDRSAEDADWVATLSRKLGIPPVCERVDVAELARERGQGVEEAARFARHRFLGQLAENVPGCVIALGHHQGDQAETVLQRLLRGSGSSGLRGMEYRQQRLIRPLLGQRREQLESYLAGIGQEWLTDPTNRDLRFTRNRIRHQLLPQLQELNPQAEAALCRMAERFALDEDYWNELLESELQTLVRYDDGLYTLSIESLQKLHPALRMRLYRRLLLEVRGSLQGISSRHLQAVEKMLLAERPQASLDLPGIWVAKRYANLLFGSEALPAAERFWRKIAGPGIYSLPGGEKLKVQRCPAATAETPYRVEFAAGQVEFPFVLRSVLPGDRFRPSGMNGTKKLKDYFIDAKMTLEERSAVLVLEGEEILWLVGMRRCAGFAVSNGSAEVIRMTLEPA